MAKIVLGKTVEQLEKEEAELQRAREAEVQQAIQDRQNKLQELHKVQKRNKYIIFGGVGLLTAVLLVFGTYNTFIKQGLTDDDVKEIVNQVRYTDVFPSEGLDNYMRDNCSALFEKYMQLDMQKDGKNIKSVEVNPDSCYILKVRKISPTIAQVYFGVDITTTENDTPVTDEATLEQLKRTGFAPTASSTESDTTSSDSDTATSSSDTGSDDNTSTSSDTSFGLTTNDTTETAQIDKSISYSSSGDSDNLDHYYTTNNGAVLKAGKVTTQRYYFYIPIELVYTYDGDTPVTSGYAPAGDMNLYSLEETDQTDFSDISIDDVFAFDEASVLDEDTTNKMQVKVDNTLRALYEGEDTSQDFLNYRKFKTYDNKYVGIDSFVAYSTPNALGYNVKLSYKVITPQGFTYTMNTYLIVEQNGSTWVIKGML